MEATKTAPPVTYTHLVNPGSATPSCSACGAMVGWDEDSQRLHTAWHRGILTTRTVASILRPASVMSNEPGGLMTAEEQRDQLLTDLARLEQISEELLPNGGA